MTKTTFSMFCLPVALMLAGCAGTPETSADDGADDPGSVASVSSELSVALSGNWVNPTPCNTTLYNPANGDFHCDGDTTQSGGMVGISHYYLKGKLDAATGNIYAVLDETFPVTIGSRSGTFRMKEAFSFTAATGEIFITGVIVSGSGGFAKARGYLTFVGTSDPSGIGNGTYSGRIWY